MERDAQPTLLEVVVENEGVRAARLAADASFPRNTPKLARPRIRDDSPSRRLRAARACRAMVQHEAARAAVQAPRDPLEAHVGGGAMRRGGHEQLRRALPFELALEGLSHARAAQRHAVA